jgi:cytochrome b561
LHAVLRTAHTVLAYMFFATILLHVAAALFHGLIRRDGVFRAMAAIGPRNQ